MYNGFDWYGRILEVREVRLAPYQHLPSFNLFRTVTPACLDLAVIVVVFAVGCGGSEAACAVRLTVGVEVMGAVGMPPVAATSRIRICTKTTQVQNNRRVDTVGRMKAVMVAATVVVMGRGVMSQSRVNKSWFAM
jgi:hypothetical protein